MTTNYIDWLKKQGVQLFEAGGIYWRLYHGTLVPAQATRCFVELSQGEASALLKESKAWFLRYASKPCEEKTEWWYIICDPYKIDKFPSKIRNMIKRGNRSCSVKRISAEWLAKYGYECYFTAYNRYKNASPVREDIFHNNILKTIGSPFEYWGVFVGDLFAGYCQCIVEGNEVSTSVIKYHPEYLKYYTSYALINSMIKHYVIENNATISNGNRSIAHDTNIQDFLLKLGFRRQFCRLNVVYQPMLKLTIKTLFPLYKLINKLPDRGPVHKLQALLYQENLRRACSVR
jgi:hypothetical protein